MSREKEKANAERMMSVEKAKADIVSGKFIEILKVDFDGATAVGMAG